MQAIREVLGLFLLEMCLIFFEFLIYFIFGLKTIFYLGLLITVIVMAITTQALYESYKHRNDKDPW